MINKILSYYTEQLDEYLKGIHKRPEGLSMVGQIGGTTGETPNKLVISLLNVERETSGGISPYVNKSPNGSFSKMHPALMLNLNVILASVFEEKRYGYSLSILSDAMRFIQTCPKFIVNGQAFTIEVMNFSMQDYNNVWTLLGGHSYPSVICKIRNLVIDGKEVTSSGRNVNSNGVNTKNSNR